jgi:hypothetical protein
MGYGEAMSQMLGLQPVHILAGNQVYFSIPFPEQAGVLPKSSPGCVCNFGKPLPQFSPRIFRFGHESGEQV